MLLHALGAHRGIWNPLLDTLALEREVFAFDLPGYGDSDPYEQGAATAHRIAQTVAEEMERLGVTEYAVAGNSFGGWIALEMALQGHAESVTAIAPAGLWREPLVPRPLVGHAIARLLYPVMPALVRLAAVRRILLSTQIAHPDRMPREDVLQLLRRYARSPGLKSAQRAMRAGSFRADLERVSVPVTLVWPEYDRLIARPRKLPEAIRNIELPGCGHLPQWDDPQAVAAALLTGSEVPAAA